MKLRIGIGVNPEFTADGESKLCGRYRIYEMVNEHFAKRILSLDEVREIIGPAIETKDGYTWTEMMGGPKLFYFREHNCYREDHIQYPVPENPENRWDQLVIEACLDAGHEVLM